MRKHGKRMTAVLLASSLLIMMVPDFVWAQSQSTQKEEVVYTNLTADGAVEEINVVNIFDLDKEGTIVDYGDYESLRNMTTKDEIHCSGEKITIDAGAGKLYYEGKMKGSVMPWNIAVHYYLDGKEYTAEEIAGKSGSLKITIRITENSQHEGSFFDDFALQASLTLDSDFCKNIVSEDATIANVGKDKQLTYTILPGKGADIKITADVTEFEMDGISINAIPLNLNVEVDDEELMDQITDLIDGVEELDNGAGELSEGAGNLQSGVKDDLKVGVVDLQSGVGTLDDGVQSLNSGIEQMQSALNTLNQQSSTLTDGSAQIKNALIQIQSALSGVSVEADGLNALTTASGQIQTGIDQIAGGISSLQQNVSYQAYLALMQQNGLDINSLKENNALAAATIQSMTESLNAQIQMMQQMGMDTSQLQAQVSALQNMTALFGANNAAIGGMESYLCAVSESFAQLQGGVAELQSQYRVFDGKIKELVEMLNGLTYQVSQLSSAVNTLVTEYEKLDDGINAYTNGVAQIAAAYSKIYSGSSQLVAGSSSLKKGTQSLSEGTRDLVSGVKELADGAEKLHDGTTAMREETTDMDAKVTDKIDELLESITGGNLQMQSFVSEQNTDVKSVQFVIKTEAVKMAEAAEPEPEEEKPPTFWQKFSALFS